MESCRLQLRGMARQLQGVPSARGHRMPTLPEYRLEELLALAANGGSWMGAAWQWPRRIMLHTAA